MKKFITIIIAILLIASVCLALVGCEQKDDNGLIILKTPKITVNGNAVTWNSVKNAKKYGIVINDKPEITITSTSYVIQDEGVSKVKVRAIGDLEKHGYSKYSEEVNVTQKEKLNAPKLEKLTADEAGNLTATWTGVEGAVKYVVTLKSREDNKEVIIDSADVTGNTHTFGNELLKEPKYYNVFVKAVSDGSKLDSVDSNTETHGVSKTLAVPQNIAFDGSDSRYIVFDSVDYAEKYYFEVRDNDDTIVTRYEATSSRDNKKAMDLSKIALTDAGTYSLFMRAEAQSQLIHSSEYAEIKTKEGEPYKLRVIEAPSNAKVDAAGVVTWDAVANPIEGMKYALNIKSGKSSNESNESTEELKFDLTTNSSAKSGLLVDVRLSIKNDYKEGIIGSIKSEPVKYSHVVKPESKDGIFEIDTFAKLNYIATEPDASYKLIANLDGLEGAIYPITKEFTGKLDGGYYSINDISIVKRGSETHLSLLGNIGVGAYVKNLGLANISIDNLGGSMSGALLAQTNSGTIDNVSAMGIIKVSGKAAGIAISNKSIISNTFVKMTLNGYDAVGGIAVDNSGDIINVRVYNSTITGSTLGKNASAEALAGGIAANSTGNIILAGVKSTKVTMSNSNVEGMTYVGGLVAKLSGGTLSESYIDNGGSSGALAAESTAREGKSAIGGMVGMMSSATLRDSYAIGGNIRTAERSATFVADVAGNSVIRDCYTANISLSTADKNILTNTHSSSTTFANNYYYTSAGVALSGSATADSAITNTKRDEMKKIAIASMGFADSAQKEFRTIKNMLYFSLKDEDGFAGGTIDDANLNGRKFAAVYTGDGVEVKEPSVKINTSTKSGVYSFDIYNYTLPDGKTTINLHKMFKIV